MKIRLTLFTAFFSITMHADAMAKEKNFMPEASGVCRLGSSLVIAGDEEKDTLWFVTAGDRKPRAIHVDGGEWDDMEDLAAIDEQHFFATTSLSRTKKGKRRAEREQLLLIQANGQQDLRIARSWSMRDALFQHLGRTLGSDIDLQTADGAAPDDGGLNVEGLTVFAGRLFLGLRSPLTRNGDALMVTIDNAAGLLAGEAPAFGAIFRWQLPSTNGIRGLTSVREGILVLGGPTDDNAGSFSLQLLRAEKDGRWSTPRSISLGGFEQLLRPEGIAELSDGRFAVVQDFEEPVKGQSPITILSR